MKIGVVAPASRLYPDTAKQIRDLFDKEFGDRAEIAFHPQCFLSSGHFAGDDKARTDALIEVANDPDIAAVWFARGGYGSGRIVRAALKGLKAAAKDKIFLGYSDNGFLLAGLYRHGYRVAHGPVPHDIRRIGGEAAVRRSLAWLIDGDKSGLEPSLDSVTPAAAFNLTILSMLIGTDLMPDLAGHVLMIEEVSEHLYAIDRLMSHITANDAVVSAEGMRLGRVSDVPPNDPPFEQTPLQIVEHWCRYAGIDYLGAADIGHDADNKIVPFGVLR